MLMCKMCTVHFSLLSGVWVNVLSVDPAPPTPPPSDKAFDHQLPYQEFTARDPSTEDMRLVVCEQGKRPFIPHTWEECSVSDSQCVCVHMNTCTYLCVCEHVCVCVCHSCGSAPCPSFLPQTLSVVSQSIQECWDASPTTRLSALRVKKTLQSLPLSTKHPLVQAA